MAEKRFGNDIVARKPSTRFYSVLSKSLDTIFGVEKRKGATRIDFRMSSSAFYSIFSGFSGIWIPFSGSKRGKERRELFFSFCDQRFTRIVLRMFRVENRKRVMLVLFLFLLLLSRFIDSWLSILNFKI